MSVAVTMPVTLEATANVDFPPRAEIRGPDPIPKGRLPTPKIQSAATAPAEPEPPKKLRFFKFYEDGEKEACGSSELAIFGFKPIDDQEIWVAGGFATAADAKCYHDNHAAADLRLYREFLSRG